MGRSYYIASCVFTSRFPALSLRIQDCVTARFGMPVVRCCVPRYKLAEFESRMPEGDCRERWRALPDSGENRTHNCKKKIVWGGGEPQTLCDFCFQLLNTPKYCFHFRLYFYLRCI